MTVERFELDLEGLGTFKAENSGYTAVF